MAMEDILKALMQSAAQQQPQQQPQQSTGGADAMSQMLGGLLGGQQSSTGSAGGDMLSQAIGALLGGQQSAGGAGAGGLLGGLQQILGGTPGTGQALPLGGSSTAMTPSNPIMALLQPVINKLAAKLGISPEIAAIISSIVLYYLVQSSPNTPGASPLNLGSVMQAMTSGRSVSPTALQQSGMVHDVMQATGMTEQQAVKSLSTTFSVMGSQLAPVKTVRGTKGLKSARGVRSKATVRGRRG
jgi:hypothetical protein